MFFDVKNSWEFVLKDYIETIEFKKLEEKVLQEYSAKNIYPCRKNLFRAFKMTDYEDVNVVILGQDPYFNENEADGLAFSCSQKKSLPPSLRNIFKELADDLHIVKENGDLSLWAKEGVLLLNTILTVEAGKANSHKDFGWENFTNYVLRKLNDKETPIVFILWGNNAIKAERFITNSKHLIIKSAHPSPLSSYRGFFGSKPFSKTNIFLSDNGIKIIKW